jgi:hypothetical protein
MRMIRATFFPCDPLPTRRLLVAALALWALLLLLLAAPRARGQAAAAPAGAAKAASASPATLPARPAAQGARMPGGGMHEGIQVHGWWVIEVRRPNGKLISHTEFENSLQAGGQEALASLLSGYAPGDWEIVLDGAPGDTQAVCTNSLYASGVGPCGIVESGGYFLTSQCPGVGEQCFPTLEFGNSPEATNVILQGSATAGVAGVVTDVETRTTFCSPSSTPSACQKMVGITNVTFTAVTLPNSSSTTAPCGGTGQVSCAVTIPEAGDTINVTVTISFQ